MIAPADAHFLFNTRVPETSILLERANGETGVQLIGNVICARFVLQDCLYCEVLSLA